MLKAVMFLSRFLTPASLVYEFIISFITSEAITSPAVDGTKDTLPNALPPVFIAFSVLNTTLTKELINEGSNISSSPGKVSINVLDPSKVAIMIATTPVYEYVDIPKIISLISIIAIIYLITKNKTLSKTKNNELEYKKEIKNILKNNVQYSFINICKYGYYYISIIVLYLVLTTL